MAEKQHTSSDKPKFRIPAYAETALELIEDAGFEAWLVGGFVRDAILGRKLCDVDIATNALWQDVDRIFREKGYRTHETGTKHGTLTVIVDEFPLEITTYRSDGKYSDGRHPDTVHFAQSIEEDLKRRDFTINALAYHPQRGLYDPYGGYADIQAHIIRTVGKAEDRFAEDGLRILRACRFCSQLGFDFEEATYNSMVYCKGMLLKMPAERITHELELFLLGDHTHFALMRCVDVLSIILPELVAMKDFDQRTPYHIYDVLEHSAYAVQNTPPELLIRLAALFHDCGKPASFFTDRSGQGHFYGHPLVSMRIAQASLDHLTLPSALKEEVLLLVRHHDDIVNPNTKAVKRMLHRLGDNPDLFRALCELKRADALSQAPQCAGRVELADNLEKILDEILDAEEAFTLSKLAIKGDDVIALGVTRGPAVGKALEAALDAVIDETLANDKKALCDFVGAWWQDNKDKFAS
ncbi:MAG: CCA tRNA nucleotidyltransferase [Eggerthellaceae bacterium]|jgi:tRNA nucleotidyltransferase (CCA-adding enzyme)